MSNIAAAPIQGVPWRSSVQFVQEVRQPIEWLIPDVFPAGAIVLLSGREGSMKSFLAMSMARAIATGEPWLGKPTKQGAVLYLDGEMPKAVLQDRLQGMGPVDPLQIWTWTDGTFPQRLDDGGLQCAAQEHALIVVDTLRRQMGDLKENTADDMAYITKALRELTRHGASVLALHHAPKDPDRQDYRGSTELGAGVDIVLTLTKKTTKTGAVLTLETRKTRYASFDPLKIHVSKGDRGPLFIIEGSQEDRERPKNDLFQLVLVVNELREQLRRDPIQHEVIQAAKMARLGGKDTIRTLLQEGEEKYWRKQRNDKRVSYASLA